MNIQSAIRLLTKPIRNLRSQKRLEKMMIAGLPGIFIPACQYLINRQADSEAANIEQMIEAERARIASYGDQKADIFYSPKPGTSGNIATEDLRPKHGEVMQYTMEQIANTGKRPPWGVVLYLLARESKARNILELGTCAGISGSYLGASPYCETFRTIEGSPSLAELARSVLAKHTKNSVVINALFDDALDQLLVTTDPIDLVFIDGHHEKVATIHYWQRILPKLSEGALVLFDDVSWSRDMRDGWEFLAEQPTFTDAIDFGTIGVCIHSSSHVGKPRYWDFRDVTGSSAIGTPHGWH